MEETYKNYTIEIEQEEGDFDPRDWDNTGIMLCSHRRYSLGDQQIGRSIMEECSNWDEVEQVIRETYNPVIIMPLYLYDHSGLSMRTYRHGYHSSWDCGQVGFIIATEKSIEKMHGKVDLTPEFLEKLENYLISEVKEYSQYLEGDVYWVRVTDPDGEELDSLGGMFGYDETMKEVQDWIDVDLKRREGISWDRMSAVPEGAC